MKTYTRAEALRDGLLVDLTWDTTEIDEGMSLQFEWQVAISAAVNKIVWRTAGVPAQAPTRDMDLPNGILERYHSLLDAACEAARGAIGSLKWLFTTTLPGDDEERGYLIAFDMGDDGRTHSVTIILTVEEWTRADDSMLFYGGFIKAEDVDRC